MLFSPIAPNYETVKAERKISVESSADIKQKCRKSKATPFHFHLATLSALIARYAEIEEFCIGLGDANRKDPDVRESLGLHLNLLPLRVRCRAEEAFGQKLKEIQQKSMEVFANSRVPFDILLNELNVPRSSSYAPMLQVFMNYRQGIQQMRSSCGCDCEGELIGGGQVAYAISVDVIKKFRRRSPRETFCPARPLGPGSCRKSSSTATSIFLSLFAKNPAARLRRPALHRQSSVDRALALGPGLSHEYTWPRTFIHGIDDMIKAYPHRVALTDSKGTVLTYSNRVNSISSRIGGFVGL